MTGRGDSMYCGLPIIELPFTDEGKENILSKNAKRFFNLPDFDGRTVGR